MQQLTFFFLLTLSTCLYSTARIYDLNDVLSIVLSLPFYIFIALIISSIVIQILISILSSIYWNYINRSKKEMEKAFKTIFPENPKPSIIKMKNSSDHKDCVLYKIQNSNISRESWENALSEIEKELGKKIINIYVNYTLDKVYLAVSKRAF